MCPYVVFKLVKKTCFLAKKRETTSGGKLNTLRDYKFPQHSWSDSRWPIWSATSDAEHDLTFVDDDNKWIPFYSICERRKLLPLVLPTYNTKTKLNTAWDWSAFPHAHITPFCTGLETGKEKDFNPEFMEYPAIQKNLSFWARVAY